MPQSLAKVAAHLVFSTEHRTPWLHTADIRTEVYAYMATILRDCVDSPAIRIGGMEDHVHVLFLISRKFAMKEIVLKAKTETSKWVKRHPDGNSNFGWQSGYGIFSVSESNIESVEKYIVNQEEHHRKGSFQDEFRELCRLHHVDIDERYVWE